MSVTQVQTSGISDDGVTNSKIADNAIGTAEIVDNAVTNSKIANGVVSATKLTGNQSGSAPIFGVRAWGRVSGNGVLTYGGNVSGISNFSVGQYTIFIDTDLDNANYAVVITIDRDPGSGSGGGRCAYVNGKTSSSFNIRIRESDAGQTGGLQSTNEDFNFIVIG